MCLQITSLFLWWRTSGPAGRGKKSIVREGTLITYYWNLLGEKISNSPREKANIGAQLTKNGKREEEG